MLGKEDRQTENTHNTNHFTGGWIIRACIVTPSHNHTETHTHTHLYISGERERERERERDYV